MFGQEIIDKKYYKRGYSGKEVSENKAKMVQLTIRESDSILRYEARDIKSDKLLRLTRYKDDLPIGKWIYLDDIDTDTYFELVYNHTEYGNLLKFDHNKKVLKSEVIGDFKAPFFSENDNRIGTYVALNMRYPGVAAKNNIQGKVISQCIIDENGKLTDISILKSAHPVLDREAARVIRQAPDWIPAEVDENPVRVHIIIETTFRLQ